MKWQDTLQFVVMVLMGAAMPLSWRLGLWMAVLLAVVSLVKIFADRHDRRSSSHPSPLTSPTNTSTHSLFNPALNGWMRAALWAAVAYVAIFAVSLLYSRDLSAGFNTLWHKAVLLIFPLCFLLTDSSYLKPLHIRIVFYALLVAVCGVFLYRTGCAVSKMIDGASLKSVTGMTFDNRHHSYYALYALVALVFVYFELAGHWGELRVWHRVLLLVATAFGILYIVLVNSRAGIIGLYVMAVLCPLHLALCHKRWWQALLVAILLVGFTFAAESLLPGHQNRVLATLDAGKEDARVGIFQSAIEVVKQKPLTGQGVGDYHEVLQGQYAEDERSLGTLNAHNQYAETLLAVGVIGLLLLLVYLLLPLVCAIGRKKVFWQVLFFMGVIMFNLLFESMLERQMGLLFIGYFLSLLVLITTLDNPQLPSAS